MWKELKKRLDSTDSYVSLILGLAVVLVIGLLTFNYLSKRQLLKIGQPAQEKTQQTPGSKSLPAVHTTIAGETLWSIAQEYYHSGYNWVDIAKANNLVNADYVEVGQQLTIPDVKPVTPAGEISATSTTALKPQQETYTVVKDDNLWDIARREYNNGYKWVDIAKANHLANPDLIHVGNVLSLPTIP